MNENPIGVTLPDIEGMMRDSAAVRWFPRLGLANTIGNLVLGRGEMLDVEAQDVAAFASKLSL